MRRPRKSSLRRISIHLGAAALGATLVGSRPAAANPRPLPFSYPYETLPAEKLELEQYTDMVPMRVANEMADGTQKGVMSIRSQLQTEFEYGITDRLEFAWYFVFRQGASAGDASMRFMGVKQRLRLRLAEEGEWPVNVGFYFEVAEFYNEIEVEEKVLLSRHFGKLNLVSNLWVEQERYFQTSESKFIYNPTVGASFEISPNVIVGTEYWARGRFDEPRPVDVISTSDAPVSTHHYLGPTALVQSGEYWLSLGTYLRLDNFSSGFEVGQPYGKVWFRAVLGIGL